MASVVEQGQCRALPGSLALADALANMLPYGVRLTRQEEQLAALQLEPLERPLLEPLEWPLLEPLERPLHLLLSTLTARRTNHFEQASSKRAAASCLSVPMEGQSLARLR